jgi:hypothetical protein
MTKDLLVALGSLVVMGLIYFAGVLRGKADKASDKRDERIAGVAKRYVEKSQGRVISGLDGLIAAGVGLLADDAEIREAIKQIIQHNEHSPVAAIDAIDSTADLFQFFLLVRESGRPLYQPGVIQELLIKAKRRHNVEK